MDPPFDGFVLDPSKCRNLSIDKKRELICKLSKWPESAPEKLQIWSRRDLVEILCATIGKERKYTGVSKQKIIECLFKSVSEKKSGENMEDTDTKPHLYPPLPLTNPQNHSKRPRKSDHPSRLPVSMNNILVNNESEAQESIKYCLNLACRAAVRQEEAFCKRCSCCICHKYDENKDPSLWLVCSSETSSEDNTCGLSCHLECALKHERSGILMTRQCSRLDGSYYCICCGRVNDLLRCWRKQLLIAKDARRVDALCYRVSLSHKILNFTARYQGLHDLVNTAMKKLESEVGPLNGLPNLARGIVNRLSVGAEVQRLCACAVESLDYLLYGGSADGRIHKSSLMISSFIKFENLSPTSVTVALCSEDELPLPQDLVGFILWHRKADTIDYSTEPTCKLFMTKRRIMITDLTPATKYSFKIIAFSSTKELGKWEVGLKTEVKDVGKCSAAERTSLSEHCANPQTNSSILSHPSSEEEESKNTTTYGDLNQLLETTFSCHGKAGILDSEKSSDCAYRDTFGSKDECINIASTLEATEQEGTPGHSDSALDEEPNSMIQTEIQTESHRDSTNSLEHNQASDFPKSQNESNVAIDDDMVVVQHGISEHTDPVTPCWLENGQEGSGRSGKCFLVENVPLKPEREPGSSSKKRTAKCNEICHKDCSLEGSYEYCVKVIRWLECEDYIETNFRVKFLTWFSLRATPQERRVVTVYVDTLIDEPASLAGQLVDTFSETVSCKRPQQESAGLCMRPWH